MKFRYRPEILHIIMIFSTLGYREYASLNTKCIRSFVLKAERKRKDIEMFPLLIRTVESVFAFCSKICNLFPFHSLLYAISNQMLTIESRLCFRKTLHGKLNFSASLVINHQH